MVSERAIGLLAGFALAALSSCAVPSTFVCREDDDCGAEGRCIQSACAFPDPACPSNLRFGEHAPLANQCVEDGIAEMGESESSSESESGSESGSETGEPDPLLLHYTFDAANLELPLVLDSSSYGLDGTLNHFAGVGPGIAGDALLFDKLAEGATIVDFPAFVLYGRAAFTLEVYARLDETDDDVHEALFYYGSDVGPPFFELYFDHTLDPARILRVAYTNAQGESFAAPCLTVFEFGAWHHLAMIQDGEQIRVYVDHVVECELPTYIIGGNAFNRARLGRLVGGGGGINGALDEFRITDGVLSTAELLPLP